MNDTQKWYLPGKSDENVGPLSIEEVGRRLQRGKIGPCTTSWCKGMAEWKPLREVEEFAGALEDLRRQRKRRAGIAVIVLLVAAALGAGGYFLYRTYVGPAPVRQARKLIDAGLYKEAGRVLGPYQAAHPENAAGQATMGEAALLLLSSRSDSWAAGADPAAHGEVAAVVGCLKAALKLDPGLQPRLEQALSAAEELIPAAAPDALGRMLVIQHAGQATGFIGTGQAVDAVLERAEELDPAQCVRQLSDPLLRRLLSWEPGKAGRLFEILVSARDTLGPADARRLIQSLKQYSGDTPEARAALAQAALDFASGSENNAAAEAALLGVAGFDEDKKAAVEEALQELRKDRDESSAVAMDDASRRRADPARGVPAAGRAEPGEATHASPADRPDEYLVGNGVVLSGDGYVLTLAHLLQGRSQVTVSHRGKAENAAVVATDESLDLAVLKMEREGCARAVLATSDRSHDSIKLCIIGGAVRHNSGRLFRQGEVELFTRFGPVRPGADAHSLVLSGPVNPGLAGSPLFDSHGDVIGLVRAPAGDGSTREACAVDIRAAVDFLRKHDIPFALGGAPIENSFSELYQVGEPTVVLLAGPGTPQANGEGLILPDSPELQLRKSIPFLGQAAAFSPDGKRIAVARHLGSGPSNRTEIILLDAQSGDELMTLTGQSGLVDSLRFSPNGDYLVSVVPQMGFHLSKENFLWNTSSGGVWQHLPPAHQAEFSPDGSMIALRVGGKSKSWRLGSKISEAVEAGIHETATGRRVAEIIPGNYRLCGEMDQCLFLPRSGRLLTVGFWYDFEQKRLEALHLWDPKTGRLLQDLDPRPALQFPEYGYVHGTASVSPDETTLVIEGYTADALAVVYDLASMRMRYTIPAGPSDHRQRMGSDFSPTGTTFMLRGGSHTGKHVRIYEPGSGTYSWRFDGGWRAVFSPDGGRLMQVLNQGFAVWDLPDAPASPLLAHRSGEGEVDDGDGRAPAAPPSSSPRTGVSEAGRPAGEKPDIGQAVDGVDPEKVEAAIAEALSTFQTGRTSEAELVVAKLTEAEKQFPGDETIPALKTHLKSLFSAAYILASAKGKMKGAEVLAARKLEEGRRDLFKKKRLTGEATIIVAKAKKEIRDSEAALLESLKEARSFSAELGKAGLDASAEALEELLQKMTPGSGMNSLNLRFSPIG